MLLFKGFLTGIANIIPGVSGGTFALILGFFDRIVDAFNNVGAHTVRAAARLVLSGFSDEARREFAEEWKRTDGWFVVRIAAGAVAAILACSFLIKWLLAEHPDVTLSFFLGLIIPSLAVPWGMMSRRGAAQLFWVLPGIALTVGVSLAFREGYAAETHGFGVELVIAFVCGAVAVSAMILPGISGSFVLLVLGQYHKVLEHLTGAVKAHAASAVWLVSVGLGCVAGLLAFSRLLHYLLARWRSATLAFLIGLVVGSFYVLWPFKVLAEQSAEPARAAVSSATAPAAGGQRDLAAKVKAKTEIVTARHRLPRSWGEFGRNMAALALGLAGALGVEALGRRSEGRRPVQAEASVTPGGG